MLHIDVSLAQNMVIGGFGDQQAAILEVHVLQVCRLSSNKWLERQPWEGWSDCRTGMEVTPNDVDARLGATLVHTSG